MVCKPIFSALVPLVVLPLPACSASQPAPQPKAETAPKAKSVAVTPAVSQPKPTADSRTRPKPGELKTFTDWTVGCDNTLRCTLGSLLPEMGGEDMTTLNLSREPGPVTAGGGKISLALETSNDVRATKRPPNVFKPDQRAAVLSRVSVCSGCGATMSSAEQPREVALHTCLQCRQT